MLRPHLHDDGQSVTLDLHGLSVDEAVDLADALVVVASERGRSSVRLIHGSSTTDRFGEARTIKTALTRLLDAGAFAPHVTSTFGTEDAVLLGLAPGASPRSPRITLSDLT